MAWKGKTPASHIFISEGYKLRQHFLILLKEPLELGDGIYPRARRRYTEWVLPIRSYVVASTFATNVEITWVLHPFAEVLDGLQVDQGRRRFWNKYGGEPLRGCTYLHLAGGTETEEKVNTGYVA